MANQQANMVAVLGTADQSYLRMSSLGGLRHLQTLSGSAQFQNNVLRSFPPSGVIGRLNTPAGLGVHGLPSSRNFQLGHAQNLNNSMNDPLKFQCTIVHGNQNGGAVQGMPVSTRPDELHLQHQKGVSSVQNLTNGVDNETILPVSSEPPDPTQRATTSCSGTLHRGVRNNNLMVETHPKNTQGGITYENLSSVDSQHAEFSLSSLDHGRCSDNWSNAVQSSGIQPNSFPPSGFSRQTSVPPTDNLTSNLSGASSTALLSDQSCDLIADTHSQGAIFSSVPGHISSHVPFLGWEDRNQDAAYHSNVICSSVNSLVPINGAVVGPAGHSSTDSAFYRNFDFNFGDPIRTKDDGVTKLTEEISLNIMDQHKAQQSCISNNLGSLEDLVSSMMKQVIICTPFY